MLEFLFLKPINISIYIKLLSFVPFLSSFVTLMIDFGRETIVLEIR